MRKSCHIMSAVAAIIILLSTDAIPSDGKQRALEFSLQVVKTYFQKDCDGFTNYLCEQFYSLVNDGPFSNQDMKVKNNLCNMSLGCVHGNHTYQEYLDSYKVEALDKSEFMSRFPQLKEVTVFQFTEKDYLFLGHEVKKGKQNFVHDDQFIFVVRETDKGFRIIATSSY